LIKAPQLYQKYYINREYEQVDLFRLLRDEFGIKSAIYPGSYIHISPSFILPKTCYIDSDKNAKKFFKNENYREYINQRKEYSEATEIQFFGQSYNKLIPDLVNKFDLLISQYAGYISKPCKDYLKIGGKLLVNNSHADAGLAYLDDDYKFIAAVYKSKGKYRISHSSLEEFFIPKKEIKDIREYLIKTGKGLGYKKTAPLYLFEKIRG